MVPVGGKSTVRSFEEIRQSVLNKTIWGVDFFMLCDRDAVYGIGLKSLEKHVSERLQMLPRYHLENYFLDEEVIAAVFAEMEADKDSWLADTKEVGDKLRRLAQQTIPLAVALKMAAAVRETIGNVDVMPKGISQDTSLDQLLKVLRERVECEKSRIIDDLNFDSIADMAKAEHAKLVKLTAGSSQAWKSEIPGRVILKRFANIAKLDAGRLKTQYIRHAKDRSVDPFLEIHEIFQGFRKAVSSD